MTPVTQLQIPSLRSVNINRAIGVILLLSGIVFAFLFWLVYIKKAAGVHSQFIKNLPAVNAGFNLLSTVFLVGGLMAILRKKYTLHMRLMFSALVSSTLFFICYVIYHNAHGETLFPHIGTIRVVYLMILFCRCRVDMPCISASRESRFRSGCMCRLLVWWCLCF